MSLALARKYRPSTFDDLVGQDSVSQTLSLALDGDRLSHAYLFSGLRGSGKTSTARIFAKALLCEEGASSHPCNSCSNCDMANESRHMDIIEMDAASNRGIDDIKELIEHTKYKPGIGRYKIFIIDEVHMLTTQAFNALLKTLEEPPDFVKFILATTDPLKLPATILSRTQHFRFKKIPQKLVLSHLEYILNKENVGYEQDALDVIARSGAGSLRDSLTLLDQAIVYSKNHVDMVTITNMLGIIEPSLLDNLLNHILAKDESNVLEFITLASEYESEMVIDELTLYLKELLFAKDGRFAPLIIDRFFRVLADAKELLALGSDGEFVLSLTLFKMIEALSTRDIDDMIRTLQKELAGAGVKAPEKEIEIPEIESQVSTKTKEIKTDKEATPSLTPSQINIPKVNNNDTNLSEQNTTIEPGKETSELDAGALKFTSLNKKIYDRDYELGQCFESNISYESFKDNALIWHSTAEDADKKMLIQHWSIIKMFVQDLFGFETKIVNIPSSKPKKKVIDTSTNPSIEDIEMKSSCIAPEAGDTEAAKEKDPSTLLKEPMVKEMIALFDPKKVRVRRKS
ncbi:MAG: DNA polymerase III subunit gamma/tau [Sulfurovum sp.]|nr:DNA polymerase III subunit gamma/tau [Sulfurovum sp.]